MDRCGQRLRQRGLTASPMLRPRKVVLVATGSEVALGGQECAAALEEQGIGTDVVSMPCTELFDEQDSGLYRADHPAQLTR